MRLDRKIAQISSRLQKAGIDTAGLDARLLSQYALGFSDTDMLVRFDYDLGKNEEQAIDGLVARRLEHEPVAHIMGEKYFWSLSFLISQDTLVPRPDSERLVEAVLSNVADMNAPLRIVDIGTGSGCLLLALLSELPQAYGVGIDINSGALKIAQKNAERLGFADRCDFVCGDFTTALGGRFDVLVSNPPYLAEDEFSSLDPDVAKFDPYSALVSGSNGLEAYDAILRDLAGWPKRPSLACFEFGYRQADALRHLVHIHGFSKPLILQDLAGRDRVAVLDLSNSV